MPLIRPCEVMTRLQNQLPKAFRGTRVSEHTSFTKGYLASPRGRLSLRLRCEPACLYLTEAELWWWFFKYLRACPSWPASDISVSASRVASCHVLFCFLLFFFAWCPHKWWRQAWQDKWCQVQARYLFKQPTVTVLVDEPTPTKACESIWFSLLCLVMI